MLFRKIASFILVLCLCLMPLGVQAANTSEAVEPIVPENLCALTLTYGYGQKTFADVPVKLYKIAEVSADMQYSLTDTFAPTGLILNQVQTAGEWEVIRSTLEAYILSHGIAPEEVLVTDPQGQAQFRELGTGMYFSVVDPVLREDGHYLFDSALIALPGLGQDGYWQYEVEVHGKAEVLPPVDPDEKIEFRVLKLWKGDEGRTDRPQSVEAEIFRDGVSWKTVVLSEENHWAYSWSAEDDGAVWSVAEPNVPQGYTVTVTMKGSSFVLTNTRIPDQPDDPGDSPQTGDTTNILVYILLMAASGTLLILLGITRKRKSE